MRKCLEVYAVAMVSFLTGATLLGQSPVITSLSHSGWLVCSNLEPGSAAMILEAADLNGPWTTNLAPQVVNSNGAVEVSGLVATSGTKYFRVRGMPRAPSNMVLIPAGSFNMGDSFLEGDLRERPVHAVYVSAFYIEKYEVTKALWDAVYTWAVTNGYYFNNSGGGKETNSPVHGVNWYDAARWCNARSEMEGREPVYYSNAAQTVVYRTNPSTISNSFVKWTANGYRLPTEAEWEKAARGGVSGHRFAWSDTDTIQHTRANYYSTNIYYYDTSVTRGFHPSYYYLGMPYTSPVGNFAPNGYGLYDMSGNLGEHCWDWYSATYYSSSPGTDPHGPESGSDRVNRGGDWANEAIGQRSAARHSLKPGTTATWQIGFRCVKRY
jgi:formylglycine-generating enzyme